MKDKIITEIKKETNIARIIYEAYPYSDLLPIDPDTDCRNIETLLAKVTNENIGDGLFKFIVTEIVEGGEGTLNGAIRVAEQAREDIESVLQALYSASHTQCNETNNSNSATELLEACKNITSYTMDLLYRMDNQVNLSDIEEVQQARNAIAKHTRKIAKQS